MKRGGQAKVGAVDAVPQEWASPLDVFEHIAPTHQHDHSPHEPALSSMKQNLHSLSQRRNKTWMR